MTQVPVRPWRCSWLKVFRWRVWGWARLEDESVPLWADDEDTLPNRPD